MRPTSIANTSDNPEAFARHVERLRRGFQRQLSRKPTLVQSTLMKRAAMLTALAEAAAGSDKITANDLVRVDNKAERARAEMYASFEREHEAQPA
jgi:hypothetical protein